jgi:hypothetical protein
MYIYIHILFVNIYVYIYKYLYIYNTKSVTNPFSVCSTLRQRDAKEYVAARGEGGPVPNLIQTKIWSSPQNLVRPKIWSRSESGPDQNLVQTLNLNYQGTRRQRACGSARRGRSRASVGTGFDKIKTPNQMAKATGAMLRERFALAGPGASVGTG